MVDKNDESGADTEFAEDVARVIHLLSLPEAGWVNGEVIRVDGGEHVSGIS